MKNESSNVPDFLITHYPNLISCPYTRQSTLICINNNCTQDAFICDNKSCACNKQHFQCPHLSIESIKNTIESKIVPAESFQQSIISKIEKTIDELSDFKSKLTTQMKKDLSLLGLTLNDEKFLNYLKRQNTQIFTGKDVFTVFNLMMTQETVLTEKDLFLEKFNKIWSSIDKQINNQTDEMFKMLELMKAKKSIKTLEIFKDSKVVLTTQMKESMLKMFEPKIIESTKLLYRGSTNNFSANKFHEICDDIPHTLTFCETEYGKIIGGYTPLVWNTSNRQIKDESGNSFIFSLTNNHKFKLDKSKTAIYQFNDYGPEFGDGSPDFYIANNANSNNNTWSKINRSYTNENYVADNVESWENFNGDPKKSYNFKVKEWEVWEVKFSE